MAAATWRTEKLTQAILTKAFRGELVPKEAELARQGCRDHEPASVLLERVRAERASAQASTCNDARRGRRGRGGCLSTTRLTLLHLDE